MKQAANGEVWYGPPVNGGPTVVRTERGLSISGTRLMLYDILDNLKWGWPHEEIREFYCLTEEQMADILAYLDAHREEAEAEYQEVVEYGKELRRYYDEKLKEHRAVHPPKPPRTPAEAELRAKIKERKKARLGQQ